MSPNQAARLFIRHVRANGARHIVVTSYGERINDTQRECDIVEAMTCTTEVMVYLAGDYVGRKRESLGRCLWCSDNTDGEELVDWDENNWADRVFPAFYALMDHQ